MVQNKHDEYKKKYISLVKARAKNWQAQRDLGYVELDNPRPNGWDVIYIPRQDIQNRQDADVFWEIINVCGVNGHIRIKSWYRNKKAKYNQYPYYPKFKILNKEKYMALRPAVRKHFSFYPKGSYNECHRVNYDFYKCNVPYFYWETKLVRSYIKSVYIIDEILLQEESEIRTQIYYLNDKFGVGMEESGPSKRYVKMYNREFRRKSKAVLRRYITDGKEDEYPLSGRNTARYDCS